MNTRYDIEVDDDVILSNLSRIQSQIFKLLPMREENKDWEKPLETISLELLGIKHLFELQGNILSLLCKLEGLLELKDEDNFMMYRRTIFECCGLIDKVKSDIR